MTVTWWTASGIILYHRSIACEISIYCCSLIYFPVAIAIITTKYQKYYFYYGYLLLPLSLLSYYFATKHFAADIKFPSLVELTIHLLILENILWLPLCQINKFGLNTLPSKIVAIPYTCGLSGGALHPRGPLVAPPTYFFLLYISIYPANIHEHHETTSPPPQPSVPERSHLGAFFGAPPEGALITKGLYINSMASPMMCE